MLIQEARFETPRLVAEHPAEFRSAKKRALFERIAPAGTHHQGTIEVRRYGSQHPTGSFDLRALDLELRPTIFEYTTTEGATDWYLNFAHHELFSCYGTRLFAQDEIQVAEHPALASLTEALLVDPVVTPLTVEDGRATPVLVRGVERRVAIDTREIYGNAFAVATDDVIERALTDLDPPTRSNLIAIEAPFGHVGAYTEAQLTFILDTAFSGFLAAVESSDGPAVVHSGFWGCGAYGGDRVLMPLLQMVAAQLAGVHRLVLYAVTAAGLPDFERVRALAAELAPDPTPVDTVVQRILRCGFVWGVSNGT
ncbi:MAG: hypothetical protein RIT81_26145 [Deltaproteobacteria bacterium]